MASRILLVEDDSSSAEIFCMILEGGGYEVEVANSPERALAAFESQRYDAAVVDMMLPGMTTEAFVDALARLTNRPPIIVHSARPEAELDLIAHKLSAFGILNKPTTMNRVLDMVASACPASA